VYGAPQNTKPQLDMSSSLHVLDARLKLCALLIFLFSTALLPFGGWAAYILLTAVVTSGMLLSHIPLWLLLRRSLVIELPFVMAALPLLFRTGGNEMLHLQAGGQTAVLTSVGIIAFSSVLVKTWLSIQAAVLFSAVTCFEDLLVGLRGLGYPKLLNAILALMGRYLSILAAEAQCMLTARKARSGAGKKDGGRCSRPLLLWQVRVNGGMVGSLMLRSIERSERVYVAMKSRGYDGEVRTVEEQRLTAGQKRIIAAMIALALLLLFVVGQIYPG